MTEPTTTPADGFSSALGRMLAEARKDLEGKDLEGDTNWLVTPDVAAGVRKFCAVMPVSCCVMTDTTGVNHCKHPPPPRPPLHRRVRWRLRSWWSGLRMRIGSRIAGVDLDEEDEW